MSQQQRSRRRGGRRSRGRRRFHRRRKVCIFCQDDIENVDYKQVKALRSFLTDRGKILPRRRTGNCAKHQRQLAVAIKRARHLALLPFSAQPKPVRRR